MQCMVIMQSDSNANLQCPVFFTAPCLSFVAVVGHLQLVVHLDDRAHVMHRVCVYFDAGAD